MIVAAIGPYLSDKGKQGARGLKQWAATVSVLNVGRMRLDQQRAPIGIDECMAFASLDLLSRIIAARAAGFGGLYTKTL